MMQFTVRYVDTRNVDNANVQQRTLAAPGEEAVRQLMQREGMTVLSVVAQRQAWPGRRAADFEVALFCEELRTLLSSGMSLVEAIDALCSKSDADGKLGILLAIKQRLLEGKPLSAALELSQFSFPVLLVASIRASERTSRIDDALEEFVGYEKVGQELSKKVISAAIYPALVVGFGFAVSLFMIAYVVPRFAQVYDDFTPDLSLPTVILLKVGQFSGHYIAYLLVVLLLLAVLGVVGYRTGKLKTTLLSLVGRFRFARYYLRLYQLARIYQTMSMLLKGGYTLSDAIPMAQNLAFDDTMRNRMVQARLAVMEGRRLSSAFAAHGLTDNVTERLLQVGERSGNLSKVMDIIAQTYRQEFTLFVERVSRLAEPILLMAVGIMIGAIIILMYMPVFDLAGGIG